MTPIKNIDLAFACCEKPDTNNFCSKCSNKVHDFRGANAGDLSRLISNPTHQVCGIFNPSQLNRTFVKSAATLAAGSLSSCSLSPDPEIQSKHSSIEVTEELPPMMGMFMESQPQYKGGMKKLMATIQQNLKIPPRECLDGAVYVSFVVKNDGTIADKKVVRGISQASDREALRVVGLLTEWQPGEQGGRKVDVRMVIPIRFSLTQAIE